MSYHKEWYAHVTLAHMWHGLLYVWHGLLYVRQDICLCVHILGQKTHPYAWHPSFVMSWLTLCVTWLTLCATRHLPLCAHPRQWWVRQWSIKTKPTLVCIQMCDMTHLCVWLDSFICVTWLIHMYDMTHSYVKQSELLFVFMCVPWLIHMCDMTHSYVWHDSFICKTKRTLVCCALAWVLSRKWMSHVIHMTESCHTYEWVMSHIWIRHVTHVTESHIILCNMTWLIC